MKCVCEYCKEIFENKRESKFCSRNCRTKYHYHKTHANSITYITGKTDEEKRIEKNEYFKNKYRNDEKFREYMNEKRRKYYKEHKK